jgi:hypothetical protein
MEGPMDGHAESMARVERLAFAREEEGSARLAVPSSPSSLAEASLPLGCVVLPVFHHSNLRCNTTSLVCVRSSPALGRCAAPWSPPPVPERDAGAAGRHGSVGPE